MPGSMRQAASGAELVCFPEVMNLIGKKHRSRRRKGADPWIFHRAAHGKGGGAWDLYPWRQHYGGDPGRKTGLQHQRAHRARRAGSWQNIRSSIPSILRWLTDGRSGNRTGSGRETQW